jgi:flagella synthesis protein FlgN
MHEDQAGYGRLRALLEEQFQAALRQRAELLLELAPRIEALVDTLDRHREARREQLRLLLGARGTISLSGLLARLPQPTAQLLGRAWERLEAQVRDCKALNARNCELIVEQHALMQRLLGAERDTYAEL